MIIINKTDDLLEYYSKIENLVRGSKQGESFGDSKIYLNKDNDIVIETLNSKTIYTKDLKDITDLKNVLPSDFENRANLFYKIRRTISRKDK